MFKRILLRLCRRSTSAVNGDDATPSSSSAGESANQTRNRFCLAIFKRASKNTSNDVVPGASRTSSAAAAAATTTAATTSKNTTKSTTKKNQPSTTKSTNTILVQSTRSTQTIINFPAGRHVAVQTPGQWPKETGRLAAGKKSVAVQTAPIEELPLPTAKRPVAVSVPCRCSTRADSNEESKPEQTTNMKQSNDVPMKNISTDEEKETTKETVVDNVNKRKRRKRRKKKRQIINSN